MHDTLLVLAKAGIAIIVIGTALVGLFWLAMKFHAEEYIIVVAIICLLAFLAADEWWTRRRTGRPA